VNKNFRQIVHAMHVSRPASQRSASSGPPSQHTIAALHPNLFVSEAIGWQMDEELSGFLLMTVDILQAFAKVNRIPLSTKGQIKNKQELALSLAETKVLGGGMRVLLLFHLFVLSV